MSRPCSVLFDLVLAAVGEQPVPAARADCMCSSLVFTLTPLDVPGPSCASEADCEEGFTPEGRSAGSAMRSG